MERAEEIRVISQPYLPYVLVPLGVYGVCKILQALVPGPQRQKKLIFRNRTVVITGASSGLGRALAFSFYKRVSSVCAI